MKPDLLKRVERIESKTNFRVGVSAIFTTYVTPGHIDRPVAGWRFGEGTERMEVLRCEGENDDDLQERAVGLARKHIGEGNVPSLTSITLAN
jgi:hypothetical protein